MIKMALHFWTVGGSGDASSIFIYSLLFYFRPKPLNTAACGAGVEEERSVNSEAEIQKINKKRQNQERAEGI